MEASIVRYAGSKAKLAQIIIHAFPRNADFWTCMWKVPEYHEVFFGSGAIAWALMKKTMHEDVSVFANDADKGIAALWMAVRDCPSELTNLIAAFRPSAEKFYEFKESDCSDKPIDPVLKGFQKLALHQMSFSGLGARAGGPLGGRNQKSNYNPECRWRAGTIIGKVKRYNGMMKRQKRFEITSTHFRNLLGKINKQAFVYLDPPYYVQGKNLYKVFMTPEEHAELATMLKAAKFQWILSYDDCPEVRSLYSWAQVESFEMTPTIQTSREKRRKNKEVVIRGGQWTQ